MPAPSSCCPSRAGRKPAARAYDAMIAAVAIANDLPLYACNPDAFSGIDDLDVVAIPHPHPDKPVAHAHVNSKPAGILARMGRSLGKARRHTS